MSFLYKKTGHINKNCRKTIRKEQEQKQDPTQNVKRCTPKIYSPCPHCQRTNHQPENCCNGPNAPNRPQDFKRHPSSTDNEESPKEGTYTQNAPPSN